MNYDHDCPFETYITNLGKYNEGELVGEWVKFPTTYEQMQEVFKRIGIGNEYEEWFITDYDCYVDGLHDALGEYESLDELNYLATSIENMDESDFTRFQAAIEYGEYTSSVKDLINLTENLDCYDVYSDIHDQTELGYYYVHEAGIYDLESMGQLANYIDYEFFGRDISLEEGGHFSEHGYVVSGRDSFIECYNGDRENIPDEYRIMSKPDDVELSEDEKLEMAQDLAFDLDEFFRQKDPQYAAAHSDAHAGKELIADLLMEGKTAAIKDRLAEMAQTPDDELPARIGEFERVTGYEAYLDNDVPAIREKLEQAQESEGTMTVLVVEPLKEPYIKDLAPGLAAMQQEVDGLIAAVYPFDDPVTLVCNDEGKMNGMELNRALRDESGRTYDVVVGTFLVTGLGEENFASLSPELAQKYLEHFKTPEMFTIINGELTVIPVAVEDIRRYDIYQLKDSDERRDYAFEPLDRLHEQGRRVDMQNYDKVYSGVMRPNENLESIYTRFNVDRPEDFTGHSLSMSDVVVIHQNGQDTAHYCDRFGFADAPEFFEQENHLKNAEMAMEDDYGMIDGIINNGQKEVAPPGGEEKSSIRERLADAKRECAERKPHDLKKPEKNGPEQDL